MTRRRTSVHVPLVGGALLFACLAGSVGLAQKPTAPAAPAPRTGAPAKPAPVASHPQTPATDFNAVVKRYCVTCHSETRKSSAGGLSLAAFDTAHATQNADVAERMIRKLQAGFMPPPSMPRPDATTYAALINTLETQIDTAAAAKPNPGVRTFQRLNRPEYARSIGDLLALDIDAGSWLPLDTKSANFDNIADAQALSPTLLESYLNAAAAISRMAVGDRNAPTIDSTYTAPIYMSQHPWDHVEGAPYGTRGGMVVEHVFPADAEYIFEVDLVSGSNSRYENIDISVDGERVALIEYETGPAGGADGRGAVPMRSEPILVKAGQHKVAAAFVRRQDGPYEDLIRPHDWSFAGGGSGGPGITTLPHVKDFVIKGPYRATGISETPSRQRIFSCRPTVPSEERACARQIIARLGAEAYRRPLSAGEIDRLMPFYEKAAAGRAGLPAEARSASGSGLPAEARSASGSGLPAEARNASGSGLPAEARSASGSGLPAEARSASGSGLPAEARSAKAGGFESGVRAALEAILASPHFIFRMEREPESARPGGAYRVADLDLASRLSYFLWATPPDQELLQLANQNRLSAPGILEKQARRMLADPRAEALGTRFAAQWLRLQDVDKVHPDPNFYPNFDDNLAELMRRETQMFFNNLVRDDRSVLELYTANYTFVNDRLATHYGIPGIAGAQFRRVAYPDDTRRGLLGQGSVLVQTSLANRTSPVLRGKWVMEVLMGTPPPPPPPDVPPFEDTGEAKDGRMLTTRERMEMHRKSPTCSSCHRFMDPIGLALDNFDVTAKWRVRENGQPLDTRGDYYDGTPVSTPAELTQALMKRPVPLVRTFTENLFAYALGRRAEYFDQPAIRAIAKSASANNYKMSSFILGVIKSDAFLMRTAEASSTQ